jgi:predicted Zn-dependent protease
VKKRLTATLLCVALIPRSLGQALPDLGDSAAGDFPPQAEQRLGAQIMRDIRWHDPSYLRDAEVEDYLNRLGDRLVASGAGAGLPFEFFALNDPSLNAFAMPGGKIGVHTGLIVATQSESELASVLSHEIAHVTQHHIARMIGRQSDGTIMMLASLLVAILAARSNSQLSQGAIMAGQAAALSSQLSYSRDFENEADRLGLQNLEAAGYDVRGMPAFFERLQKGGRLYESNAPAYLRTHPLTTERITEMENRVQQKPYRQVPDSLDFQLVRAKLRVLAGPQREVIAEFAGKQGVAARYGLALALLKAGRLGDADRALIDLRKTGAPSPMIEGLAAELRLAHKEPLAAATLLHEARARFPQALSLTYGEAGALLDGGRAEQALGVVMPEIQTTPENATLWELQAKAQSALGRRLAQHRSQAEVYAIQGNYAAAVEQLTLAGKAGDGDFFEQSAVESRLRDLRVQLVEQMKEQKEQR